MPTNGLKARLDSLAEAVRENRVQIDRLVQGGCPTGRAKMNSVEHGLEDLRKDINEIFNRMRAVEARQNYWGGGLAALIVALKFLWT